MTTMVTISDQMNGITGQPKTITSLSTLLDGKGSIIIQPLLLQLLLQYREK